jgi:hypothetical protein
MSVLPSKRGGLRVQETFFLTGCSQIGWRCKVAQSGAIWCNCPRGDRVFARWVRVEGVRFDNTPLQQTMGGEIKGIEFFRSVGG